MCTITSTDPQRTEEYVVLALLTSKIASSVFDAAMSPRAVMDPHDRYYQAWSDLRRIADAFLNRSSVKLTAAEQCDLYEAFHIAHNNSHPEISHLSYVRCGCFTATMIRSVVDLLASAKREAVPR